MTIKNKLYLAFATLFMVILLLGGMGSYYLRELAADSRAIIQNNYRTLQYMQGLENQLNLLQSRCASYILDSDSVPFTDEAFSEIRYMLSLQQGNITEAGERKLTSDLMEDFETLFKKVNGLTLSAAKQAYYLGHVEPLIISIREKISVIHSLNEEALLQRNENAHKTSDRVVIYMTVIAGLALVTGLVFLLSIPAYISKPISHFMEAISRMASGNYQLEIPVHTKDEFGQLARSLSSMAEKLSEYENSNLAKVLLEKRRTEGIINSLREPVIGLDESKNILFINPSAAKLLSLNAEEVVGTHGPDLAVNHDLMRNLLAGLIHPTTKNENPMKIPNGNVDHYYLKEYVDIYFSGKDVQKLAGHLIILNDVTQFAEKDIAKTQFIATVSHELKTPTAAIELSTQLMNNPKVGELNEEQRTLLDTITSNTRRIKHMIHEVLDISRIESGYIDLTSAFADPLEIAESAIQAVQPFLDDKQIIITRALSRNLPPIKVDAHKMIWVLNNFLTNAIRYSPEGGEIVVEAKKQQGWVHFVIHDQGPGISAENQTRIFDKYTRVPNDRSVGTGLGLAISKEFIEAMGGTIGVSSTVGEGSRFWVQLPVDA